MNIHKILLPDKSCLVNASAGTGKTWILVSKILRLLLEDVSPENITAITFTKKAANEMRERLDSRIESWLKMSKEEIKEDLKTLGIEDSKKYIKSAKDIYFKIQDRETSYRITTYHSFFLEIISCFSWQKDMPKTFKINEYRKLIINEVDKKVFSPSYLYKEKNLNAVINILSKEFNSLNNIKKSMHNVVEKKADFLEYKNSNGQIFLDKIIEDKLSKKKNLQYEEINALWKYLAFIYIDEYQKTLRNKDLIDYDDIEFLCFSYLSSFDSKDWIFYKIANSVHHLLLDEFQDTNYRQWRIMELIINAISDIHQNSTVTIVGDEMQSIYGFRGSKPQLIKTAGDFLNKINGAKKYYLNTSRRSGKEIINFVNKNFDKLNNKFNTKLINESNVERITLEISSSKEKYNEEAKLISNKIKELIDKKYKIYEGEKTRDISYKDIMVLLRDRLHMYEIEEELKRNYIPYITDKANNFILSNEVQDVIAFLKFLILNNNDKKTLLTILSSPIFFSKEENLENIDKLTDKDIRLKIFKNKIINDNYSIWKNNIRKYPIHDVLDDIYNKLNIFNICKDTFSYKQYHIIENNLNSFLNLSLNHNSGRYITPLNFLYFLENIDAESSKTDIDNLNALRLYTIHGSKGLESPVVFISQTYHKINGKIKPMDIIPLYENNNSIDDIFIFMQGFKENEKFSKFYSKHLEDVKREEENILYVACTRAKQQLIVTGYSDSNKDSYFNFLNL